MCFQPTKNNVQIFQIFVPRSCCNFPVVSQYSSLSKHPFLIHQCLGASAQMVRWHRLQSQRPWFLVYRVSQTSREGRVREWTPRGRSPFLSSDSTLEPSAQEATDLLTSCSAPCTRCMTTPSWRRNSLWQYLANIWRSVYWSLPHFGLCKLQWNISRSRSEFCDACYRVKPGTSCHHCPLTMCTYNCPLTMCIPRVLQINTSLSHCVS